MQTIEITYIQTRMNAQFTVRTSFRNSFRPKVNENEIINRTVQRVDIEEKSVYENCSHTN